MEAKKDNMKNELKRNFSGFFGEYIIFIISDYIIDETLDTQDKKDAWQSIIKKLSNADGLEINDDMKKYIEADTINWDLIERLVESRKKHNPMMNEDSVYNYTDVLNNFPATEEDMNFCEILFKYMSTKKNIKYKNYICSLISGDLKIISEKYRKIEEENTKSKKGMVSLPEMTFVACEYRRIIPFGSVNYLIDDFKSKINKIKNTINADNIYVIKGINALPEYKEPRFSIKNLGFSFVVGVQVSNAESIPQDMKVFKVPQHRYICYSSKESENIQKLIMDDLSEINSLNEKYRLSNFPLLELYDKDYKGEENSKFYTYMPIE
ncbi:hypothetical protein J2Z42_001163 [Clostridium algifaecis]|uniref:Integron-associated effector binding protein domain-containing protein n=1 Tax=Clostridium algifaecis TaxID=1472040 RepID=A0ABS4KR23_9CLOT|nr:GyrI-like domain-containing protein [Clostridium algifaecis]MBP2032491.1 hypothetical protein [Clostridium algifaecis]